MGDWTIENLRGVEDSAAPAGMGELQEARFAAKALEARATGLSLQEVKPGKRQGFGHVHETAEEVYVVLRGSGRVKLDDEICDLRPLDAVRVAPTVVRAFEGGPDGIELLVFGPLIPGDAAIRPDFWPAEA